jgi:hypothetical protein
MRTILVASVSALALLTAASFVLAQENQPQGGGYCPHLTRDLTYGDNDSNTGGQVTELQKFLASYYEDYPEGYITGRFRNTTKQFVIRFQREQNLPAFGYVGALTRAAIARVCAGTPTIPPPANPPPPPAQPTCTLNANPSSITLNQSSTLTWSSTNATGGAISTIGTVSPNGSQSVHPLTTTTYLGTFWNTTSSATCNTTVTVTTQTTNNSCTFNNQTIPDNQSVTAYQSSSVPAGQQCVSQTRTCHNGTLDGTYQYASCTPLPPPICTPLPPQTQTLSCPGGQTGSITQTRTSTCPGPTWGPWVTTSNTCTTQTTSTNATLTATPSSGQAPLNVAFTYSGVSYLQVNLLKIDYGDGSPGGGLGAGGTCTPTCSGEMMSHTYATPGTYTAKLTTNGTTLATATITVTGTAASTSGVGSCIYKGTTYAEGQTISVPVLPGNPLTCDNGTWIEDTSIGNDVCDDMTALGIAYTIDPTMKTDLGCGTLTKPRGVTPRHGRVPLTVKATQNLPPFTSNDPSCGPFTISWGDGTTENFSDPLGPYHCSPEYLNPRTHTYASPGIFGLVIKKGAFTYFANIRVDGPTASANNSFQLANALTALQSALQALLQLFQ